MKRIIITIVSFMLLVRAFGQTDFNVDNGIKLDQSRLSPRLLNYQGFLTDTLGNPITSPSVSMTFAIYDAVSAGNQKWSETQGAVNVDKGIVHVLLGSVAAIPDSVFNNANRWLQLTVAGQVLTPRTRIVSAPYAYTAIYSDTAQYARNAAPDNDWVISGNNMYSGVSGNVGMGTTNPLVKLDVNGIVCGGAGDTVKAVYGGVLGGYSNLAGDATADTGAVVAGGWDNTVTGKYSFVGGGQNNTATYYHATVGGGFADTAYGSYSTVGGGFHNVAGGYSSTVSGGYLSTAGASYSAVGGGYQNNASAVYAIISGGYQGIASGNYATVGGGYQNTASGFSATVGGGYADSSKAPYGGVLSGYCNVGGDDNLDTAATVAGGLYNVVDGKYSFVGGGCRNAAYGNYATAGGGDFNTASGDYSTVSGGESNRALNQYATVGGGYGNYVYNFGATVAGGYCDSSYAVYSFSVGLNSTVRTWDDNSAAFNGQTSTASGQTRVGMLSKASGTFTIDHPLDPENKILNHYFVESPEMVLIYRGSAIIGENGRAVVRLPDYFDALNKNPMVQLTGVGSFEVCIAEDVKGNQFAIGGKPGTKVYWTVTGERKDPSAEITKIIMPVEQPKEGGLIGGSLDDEFLVTTKAQLERMGKADGFNFRHASEQNRYEEMKKMVQENNK